MKKYLLLLLNLSIIAFCPLQAQTDCEPLNYQDNLQNYSTIEEAGFQTVSVLSGYEFYANGLYGFCINGYNKHEEINSWLISPVFNTLGAETVTLKFQHQLYRGNNPYNGGSYCMLYVTDNYTGDPTTTEWEKIALSPEDYDNNWKDVKLDVPSSVFSENMVVGFYYESNYDVDPNNAFYWEIRNFSVTSTCPSAGSGSGSGSSSYRPEDIIKVCGQNLENYYYNWTNDGNRAGFSSDADFVDKTHKIVDAFLEIDADIYAVCEIEAIDLAVKQLADSMNRISGKNVYSAVADYITYDPTDGYNNHIKSAFIYRNDRVTPIGSNYAASTYNYYKNTMRIQTFKQNSNDERFTLSMNHFKAGGEDQEPQRIINATQLINALRSPMDPDVLIMGDLNTQLGAESLDLIQEEGYSEQLVRFLGSDIYSHCYGGGELIDHVFANESMAKQVKDADIYHVCTSCSSGYSYYRSYSDHDPYSVSIVLGNYSGLDVQKAAQAVEVKKIILDGQIYILRDGTLYNLFGAKVK